MTDQQHLHSTSAEIRNLRDEMIRNTAKLESMAETIARVAGALEKLAVLEERAIAMRAEIEMLKTNVAELQRGFWKATGIATAMAMAAGWLSTRLFGG